MATLDSHSVTDYCLVDLIDVTLVCENAKSKLVEFITVADRLIIIKLNFCSDFERKDWSRF